MASSDGSNVQMQEQLRICSNYDKIYVLMKQGDHVLSRRARIQNEINIE